MWLLLTRQPRPDLPVWRGRRLLAALDALVWPVAWVLVVRQAPEPAGVVESFITAMAVVLGMGRLRRAWWVNHRYRFTTWRWGRVVAGLLLFGAILKVAASA